MSGDILGNNGKDKIENNGTVLTIDGGEDNDNITNSTNGTINNNIDGGTGNDTITNNGTVLGDILGNEGDDVIENNGTISTIYGGADNDNIINSTNGTINNNIDGETGNDTITNNGTVLGDILGNEGDDVIENNGTISTIYGGKGSDSIINNRIISYIYGNDGQDNINNGESGIVNNDISGGFGNDIVTNDGIVIGSIYGDNSNDTITNNGKVSAIYGGQGDDIIITGEKSSADYIYFNKGDGKDNLYLNAKINNLELDSYYEVKKIYWNEKDLMIFYDNSTDSITIKNYNPENENIIVNIDDFDFSKIVSNYINQIFYYKVNKKDNTLNKDFEGTDNIDVMFNNGVVHGNINSNNGNDTIINNGAVYKIYGGDGNDNIINEINASISDNIYGDDGDDTITNKGTVKHSIWGDAGHIYGGNGNDTITNDGVASYICGDDGNDIITNNGSVFTINGDDGNDTIENKGAADYDIYGGDGNDTITNDGVASYIDGGGGNDIITNNGTIEHHIGGGSGDDIILTGENSSVGFIEFFRNDGKDTLYLNSKINNIQFGTNLTDKIYTWAKNDLVISFSNSSDSVTIKNYNPNNKNVIVNIGYYNNFNVDTEYTDLATLIPDKPTVNTLSLNMSNSNIDELNSQIATFNSASSTSDFSLTDDSTDMPSIMTYFTDTANWKNI